MLRNAAREWRRGTTVSRPRALVAAAILTSLFVLGSTPTPMHAQEQPDQSSGVLRFAGEVTRGMAYEHLVTDELSFQLIPTDYGWDISVRGPVGDEDLVWVATPPFRLDNPRYVGTIYGHSAADAVGWSPREFFFLMHEGDYPVARDAVDRLLWPYEYTDAQVDEARAALNALDTGRGTLMIEDANIEDGADGTDAIASLRFSVELSLHVTKLLPN